MKRGCLFLLAVLIGMTFLYRALFDGTALAEKWWIAPLLALSVTLVVANLQGIIQAIRQKIISQRSPRDWKTGELIGISGKLQPVRTPIEAPISGRSCVIVEYDISRPSSSSKSAPSAIFSGMLMVPCAVHTMRGPVKLIGFPLIVMHDSYSSELDEDYRRAARYIASTQFKERPTNPLTLISQLNEILNDPDGEVKEDLKDPSFSLLSYGPENFDEEEAESENELPEEVAPTGMAGEEELYQRLRQGNYLLEEKAFEAGSEVTVFGTYDASRQLVNIGSGLKNLMHTVQPGKIEDFVRKNLRNSIIMTIFWLAVALGANWYVFRLVGIDLIEVMQTELKKLGIE